MDNFVCNVCRQSTSAHFFARVTGIDGAEYNLVRCDNCGMVSVWPLPTEDFLRDFYSINYHGKVKDGIVEWENPTEVNKQIIEDCIVKLRYVERYAGYHQKGRFLDIGCGHGFCIYAAQSLGYDAVGVDIDTEAIDFGRSRLKVDIIKESIDSLDTVLPHGSFDVITAWTVLEHLSMPSNCCQQVYTLLKHGGVFAGAVPNIGGILARMRGARWHLMIPPEHLQYFNTLSMKRMLAEAGLVPVFVGTVPLYAAPYFSLGIRSFIMRVSRRSSSSSSKAVSGWLHRGLTLGKRYVVYWLLNRLIIKLQLGGDNLFFVARKGDNQSAGC